MREVSDEISTRRNEIRVNRSAEAESRFRPELFGEVARLVWPKKTCAELTKIAEVSDRTARFWLKGKAPAPMVVYLAMVAKIAGLKIGD